MSLRKSLRIGGEPGRGDRVLDAPAEEEGREAVAIVYPMQRGLINAQKGQRRESLSLCKEGLSMHERVNAKIVYP